MSDNEGSKPHSDDESPNTSGTEPRSAMASAVSNDGDSSPSERTPPRTLPSSPENPEPEDRPLTSFNTESRGAVARAFSNDDGSRAGVLNVPAYAKNDLHAPENAHLLERSIMSPAESSSSRNRENTIESPPPVEYGDEQDSSNSCGSSVQPTPVPHEKVWECLPDIKPEKKQTADFRPFSAVCENLSLYIAAFNVGTEKTHEKGVEMWYVKGALQVRSKLKKMEVPQHSPRVVDCMGLQTHGDKIYALFRLDNEFGEEKFRYQVVFEGTLARSPSDPGWKALPACPVIQYWPGFYVDEDENILLIGGNATSHYVPTRHISFFNRRDGNWGIKHLHRTEDSYPRIPHECNQLNVLKFDKSIHLIGGNYRYTPFERAPVLCLARDNSRWHWIHSCRPKDCTNPRPRGDDGPCRCVVTNLPNLCPCITTTYQRAVACNVRYHGWDYIAIVGGVERRPIRMVRDECQLLPAGDRRQVVDMPPPSSAFPGAQDPCPTYLSSLVSYKNQLVLLRNAEDNCCLRVQLGNP